MRRRIELGRLLKDKGLLSLVRRRRGGGRKANENILGQGNAHAAPERSLQREKKPRDDGSQGHNSVVIDGMCGGKCHNFALKST